MGMGLPASARAIGFVLTADLDRTRPFYRDVLGLRFLSEDSFAAVFDCHGMVLRLTSVEGHVPHPHTVLGWQVDDLTAVMADLRARGVTFNIYPGLGQDAEGVWTMSGGTVRVCWFNDPEGNGLSLTQM
jgi:catechol 2,3-dioxygenase-like lactoylglutathione lyase family enzyme